MGYASVTNGTNVIPITATDYSNNSRTNKYQIIVTNTVGSQTLAFDLNGNMTNDGGGISYEYDAANRTVAINRGTTNRTEFSYDGAGRRVQIIERTNGVAYTTNKYVWDGMELCEQRDSTGATVTKRFFGDGEQINGTNYYFTGDHLGSIREVVDSAGVIQARYDYDPYGRRTKVSGTLDADFGFTGHFMLSSQPETTLTLYRLYRADLGRWLSKDPLAEGAGLNLYAYCGNNPLNERDPDGRFSGPFYAVVGLIAVAIVVAYVVNPWIKTKSDPNGNYAETHGPFTFYGPSFEGLPPPVQEGIRLHESIHKYHQFPWPWPDLFKRELEAYKAEKAFLEEALKDKKNDCYKTGIQKRLDEIDGLLKNNAEGLKELVKPDK